MQTYELLFVIAIGCFGLALICFSLISGDQDPMKPHAPEEPRLYEGATPQFDVEVEPGTYQYDPATGETNIPKNEFDLYMLYTIDDYNQLLTELHIRHSHSHKGCPYDNAPMESFHASLKKECIYPVPVFENYETAAAVFLDMCVLSTIGREFIVHWATRPPYKLKSQHLRAKWPPDLMLSMVQISY